MIAKEYPDVKFIIYHSGYGNNGGFFLGEGAYAQGSLVGTNSLITSLLQNGLGPNSNVYAELGTTWQMIKNNTTLAAHVIGKLLRYVGENNVVWGTDSMWYGSPQEQIQGSSSSTTRSSRVPVRLPLLTMDIKRKVLGLNAARAYASTRQGPLRYRSLGARAYKRSWTRSMPLPLGAEPPDARQPPRVHRLLRDKIRKGEARVKRALAHSTINVASAHSTPPRLSCTTAQSLFARLSRREKFGLGVAIGLR